MIVQPLRPLQKTVHPEHLFAAWLGDGLPGELVVAGKERASLELQDFETGARVGKSPFFSGVIATAEGKEWAATNASDYPDPESADLFRQQLEKLCHGQAQVVITGQQPGFMGGPLYTLYKAATAVALALEHSRAGRLTVPVFWMGDDDDDVAEALASVVWDPLTKDLWGCGLDRASLGHLNQDRPSVGNLGAQRFSARGKAWLEAMAAHGSEDPLVTALATLWAEAYQEDWTWTRLFRRFLLHLFGKHGLVVVSGNDDFLHAQAGPLYEEILSRRPALRKLVEGRGESLERAGFARAISDRSLHRHLFQSGGRGRSFLPDQAAPTALHKLRPGVMLRSPVQDWLFKPAAVVVGPGELAYLRQLDPLYRALGVDRSPLVPRLSVQCLPPDISPEQFLALSVRPVPGGPDRWADQVGTRVEREVAKLLESELDVTPERALRLASGRRRRFQRGLVSLFQGEQENQLRTRLELLPPWVFPRGKRQERLLSSAGAVTLWGDDFLSAILQAAHEHLDLGQQNKWREFLIQP